MDKQKLLKVGDDLLSKVTPLKKKAKILSKKEIAKGTLLVKFELLNDKVNFKPGQFFFIELPQLSYPDDRGKRRHFSIVNSPNENTILSLTTRVRDSGFKQTLKELPIGTEVEVGPISGFFTLPEDTQEPLVFIALGIGITPYISMLRYIQEKSLNIKVIVVYSDSDMESMAYLDEIKEMIKVNPNLKLIMTVTKDKNWKGENRYVDATFIKDYIYNPNDYIYFISGPPNAVAAVEKSLKEADIKNVKSENFSGY